MATVKAGASSSCPAAARMRKAAARRLGATAAGQLGGGAGGGAAGALGGTRQKRERSSAGLRMLASAGTKGGQGRDAAAGLMGAGQGSCWLCSGGLSVHAVWRVFSGHAAAVCTCCQLH
jgi:hypothetical protein